MKAQEKVILLVGLCGIGLSLVGWVFNIQNLLNARALSGEVILQAIGVVVAPLGAVLGWLL